MTSVSGLSQFTRMADGPNDPQGWKLEMFEEFCESTHDLYLVQKRIADDMLSGLNDPLTDDHEVLVQSLHQGFLCRQLQSTFSNRYPILLKEIGGMKRSDQHAKDLMQELQNSAPGRKAFDMYCFGESLTALLRTLALCSHSCAFTRACPRSRMTHITIQK